MTATILLGNPKEPVELGNLNTCADVKLCLFMPALEIVLHETEVLKELVMVSTNGFAGKLLSTDRKESWFLTIKNILTKSNEIDQFS